MATIRTSDGTDIYFKDWGSGQPVVFSHGWPLTGDAWDAQMVFLASHGFMHGDDDQIVPIGASALQTAKLVKNVTLKVYPGLSHGMCTINADQINADLLAFLK